MVHKQGAGVDDLGHLLPSITQGGGGGGGGGGHIIIILRTPALWNTSARHSCSSESILNTSKCLCLRF